MRRYSRQLNQRKFLAVGSSAIIIFTSTGCGEAIHNSAEDNSFIRQPGTNAETFSNIKMKSGSLFPIKAGIVWRNRVTLRRIAGPVGSSSDPNADDQGNPFPVAYERAVTAGLRPLAGGGGNGVCIDVRSEKQNKTNRTEIFKVDKQGISLSAISGERSLAAIPPLPLITYPVREGGITKWTGTIRLNNKSYAGQGYSRIGSLEEIDLPQGKVLAYRADTALIAIVDGRQASFPMSRWFAPGVGMVRQRFVSGNIEVTKNTVRYKM